MHNHVGWVVNLPGGTERGDEILCRLDKREELHAGKTSVRKSVPREHRLSRKLSF